MATKVTIEDGWEEFKREVIERSNFDEQPKEVIARSAFYSGVAWAMAVKDELNAGHWIELAGYAESMTES